MKSYLNNQSAPRGIRNNNPGNLIRTNIKWLGKIPFTESTDKKFEQFRSVEYGIRAMAADLLNDIEKGKNTIQKIVYEFAPPSENETSAYIKAVSDSTGIKPTEPIKPSKEILAALIKAHIKVENGKAASQYIPDADIKAGIDLLPTSLKSKLITTAAVITPIFLLILGLLYIKK